MYGVDVRLADLSHSLLRIEIAFGLVDCIDRPDAIEIAICMNAIRLFAVNGEVRETILSVTLSRDRTSGSRQAGDCSESLRVQNLYVEDYRARIVPA